ncbi:putative alpha-galactosyltransferase [Synechococcus sp. BIOS-E4-1]|uniref:glycosyltransferase family 4 protein n=1 Tax=Synechococcus sp. BIOS-E4-1 TaxID=1400864 RepID=UPI0016468317|nr:glycosyltransferase [Synechococcus sp. BIOS-E4-1]QNI52880.1 putative alpha-galactosyltransferase [Synechococcus sp. BIOS-E4-1]
MLNIVFVITNLSTGGAETMLYKLLKHIDRTRFNPTVISLVGFGEIGPLIRALDLPVFVLGANPKIPNPIIIFRLYYLIRSLNPDIVHTWMYHADFLGGLTARLAGCQRIVWGIRHSNLSLSKNKFSTLLVVKLCSFLSHQIPCRILSCSEFAKDIHISTGYVANKFHVIPNGFELDQFFPDPSSSLGLRAELGLSPQTILVGLIARFDPQKNHLGFIKAAALVNSKLPDIHFVLAGHRVDPFNNELMTAIAAYDLQDHMHLLGRRKDVPFLMASLDVLASSSHGEAFSNVLGEAMSCGVPCVVTDVGDSAEIVGNTGRVVPAGDMVSLGLALVELLSLPSAEKSALGLQARSRVKAHYEICHVAGLYESFYEQVFVNPCAVS